jgi:uncharacterized protein (DUF433 family)
MGGKACIAGTRITVDMLLMQISEGLTHEELLIEYPILSKEDITEALFICRMGCRSKRRIYNVCCLGVPVREVVDPLAAAHAYEPQGELDRLFDREEHV